MLVKNNMLNNTIDPSDMKSAIIQFPDQIRESFEIMKSWYTDKNYKDLRNILIIGMGGSAIGGDVARVIAQNDSMLPIWVNRSYNIPEWVSPNTLVIASSYSGNTEETLSAFDKCRQKKSPIFVLTTGGDIGRYADKYRLEKILIPTGYEPRAALGFSFTIILILLNKLSIIKGNTLNMVSDIVEPIKSISKEMQKKNNKALRLAEKIYETCPIIYGSEDLTWVAALRFRGQLAENSKMLAFHNSFPEQNHNEIEGWTCNKDIMKKMSIIWLIDKSDNIGVQRRMKISSNLLKSKPSLQININQDGANKIERLIKLIHLIDWVSYYCALFNKVDPTPVDRIQELKAKISQGE